jgi:PAS domain S-box-containing protein
MKTISILLIEDNPPDLRLIEEMLKEISLFAFRLVSAITLKDSLKQIQKNKFDIILLDLNLPDSSGQQTFQKVFACNNNIPIVLVSGLNDEELSLKLINEGAQDYITKQSLTPTLLGKSIQYTIERKKNQTSTQKSKDYLDKIINSVASPIFVKDDKHNFCLVNDALCKLLNLNREELIGKTGMEHFPDDQQEVFFTKDKEVLNTGKENINEEQLTDGTGKIRTIVTSKTLYTDSADNKFLVGVINDITERKQVENKIQTIAKSWQETFDSVSDAIWVIGVDGKIIRSNKASETMLGIKETDICDRYCWEVLHHTNEPIKECPLSCMKNSLKREVFVLNENNRWLEVTVDPIIKENGELSGIVHTIIDRTEQMQALDNVRKSENRYRALLESLFDIVYITDYNHMMIYANPALETQTGYTTDDFNKNEGKLSFVYPDDYDRVLSFINDYKKSNKQYSSVLESRFVIKTGELRWHSTIISKVDYSGIPVLQFICRDITEQKQLDDALQESETFSRLLVENQVDLICRWNLDFKLTFINNAYVVFYELPKEEILGKNWLDFMPEHAKDKTRKYYLDFFKHPSIDSYEHEVITKKGDIHWIEWTNCPLYDGDGILTGFQSTGRDITHKKYLDEQIQDQLSFINSLLESIPIPVFYKDEELKYTGCNTAYEKFLGISSDLMIGKTVYDLSDKEQADIFHQTDLIVLQTGEIQSYETKIKDRNGILHDAIFQKSPFRDNKNNIKGIIGAFFDISERKKMEDELKKSEERYRMLIENQGEGLGIVDLAEKFIFVNPAGEEIFEVEPGCLLNHSLYDFVPDSKAIIRKESEKRQQNQKTTYELPIRTAKGNFRHLLVSATPQKNALGDVTGTFGVFRDITERKATEDALKTSEEKYRLITDNINDLVWVMDLELNSVFVSPSFYRILGYTVEERKSLSTDKLLTPQSYKKVVEAIKETVYKIQKGIIKDKNYTVKIEVEQVRKDGSVFWAESNVGATYDGNGNIIGIQGVTRDISDRKKAEQQLIEKEERFRLMMENLPIPVGAYKIKSKEIVFLNPRFSDAFGYSFEELKNINDWFKVSITEKAERKKVEQGWETAIAENKNRVETDKSVFELLVNCKNGTSKTVEISFTLDRNTVFIVFNDITERKQILNNLEKEIGKRTRDLALINDQLQLELYERKKQAEKLRYSENLNNTTINAINDNIFVMDDKLNIIMHNDALQQYLKSNIPDKKNTYSKIDGKNIENIFTEFNKSLIKRFYRIVSKCIGFSDSIKLTRNGKIQYMEIKAVPLITNDKVTQIVTSMHNITKLKQVEEEIKFNLQREKELNIMKTRFISIVSHEYRTPLASIQSSIQLIERYKNKLGEEKVASLFSGIYETIRYSNMLLDDISIIGKDDSGRLSVNIAEFNINEICKQCIDDTKAIYKDVVNLHYSIDPLLKNAYIDESLMRHVLNNILSNAVKYSAQKKAVDFKVCIKNNFLQFLIQDYGRGIPENDLIRIFEPFHRAANIENIKGTGLGLTIVKRCVELHDGTIELKSKLGKGTRVIINIPYRTQ